MYSSNSKPLKVFNILREVLRCLKFKFVFKINLKLISCEIKEFLIIVKN